MNKAVTFENANSVNTEMSEADRSEITAAVLRSAPDHLLLNALSEGMKSAFEAQATRMITVLDNLLYRVASWCLCDFGAAPTQEQFAQAALVAASPESFIEVRMDGVAPSGGKKGVSEHWSAVITNEWCRDINDLRLILRAMKAAGLVEIPTLSERYNQAKKTATERREFAQSRAALREEAMKAKVREVLDENGI